MSPKENVLLRIAKARAFVGLGWAIMIVLWFTVTQEASNCEHSNVGWNVCAHGDGVGRECASVAGQLELQKGLSQVKGVSKVGWLCCGNTLEFAVDPCSQGMQ